MRRSHEGYRLGPVSMPLVVMPVEAWLVDNTLGIAASVWFAGGCKSVGEDYYLELR